MTRVLGAKAEILKAGSRQADGVIFDNNSGHIDVVAGERTHASRIGLEIFHVNIFRSHISQPAVRVSAGLVVRWLGPEQGTVIEGGLREKLRPARTSDRDRETIECDQRRE